MPNRRLRPCRSSIVPRLSRPQSNNTTSSCNCDAPAGPISLSIKETTQCKHALVEVLHALAQVPGCRSFVASASVGVR